MAAGIVGAGPYGGAMSEGTDQYEVNRRLFHVVHDVAVAHAGQPADAVAGVLRERLPREAGLAEEEIRRIAEEISVGRDPSGW